MLFQPFICFFWISYFIVFIYFVLIYLQAFWYNWRIYKVLQNMSSTYVVLFPFVLWANIRIIATVGRPVVPPSLSSACSVLSDSNVALYHAAVHVFGVNLMCLLCLHFPLGIRHCTVMCLTTFSHSDMQGGYHYPHYTDEKTEVQNTLMTSQGHTDEIRPELKFLWYQSLFAFPSAERGPIPLIHLWLGEIICLMWPPHLYTLSAPLN